MPKNQIITLSGYRFRLTRLTGFRAAEARWTLAGIAGDAAITALLMADGLMTPEQLARVGEVGKRQVQAMAILNGAMSRANMTSEGLRVMVDWFVCGCTELLRADEDGEPLDAVPIENPGSLDEHLDGESDGDVWTALALYGVLTNLGPSIAVDGIGGASSQTEPTG